MSDILAVIIGGTIGLLLVTAVHLFFYIKHERIYKERLSKPAWMRDDE